MLQGSSKSVQIVAKLSAVRYCLPVTAPTATSLHAVVARPRNHHSIRTASSSTTTTATTSTGSTKKTTPPVPINPPHIYSSSIGFGSTDTFVNNSLIPDVPEIHYEPEVITIDAATKALYDQLPKGEYWDRTPEDIRLMSNSGDESIYKLGKHRSNALELVHRIPVVEVDGNVAVCDGGGGAMGHPLEYISLLVPGSVEYCIYCSLRFTKKKDSSAH